jgi:hypothetical protein
MSTHTAQLDYNIPICYVEIYLSNPWTCLDSYFFLITKINRIAFKGNGCPLNDGVIVPEETLV